MGLVKGGFQRLFQTFLYALAFCCAGIILGIYSYFLSVLADRSLRIAAWKKAVEGISGAAVLYTIAAVLLTCCLGGVGVFAFIAIIMDILFIGGMIAIAILTRHGASSCSGTVDTPIGTGSSDSTASGYGTNGQYDTYEANLGLACRLNTAAFAVSIIGAFLFLCTALMQLALIRHHKKEKAFGPSPKNNYTSGSGKTKQKRGLFGRKNKKTNHTEKDAELGAAGVGAGALAAEHHHHHNNNRASHDTALTGSTVGANNGHHTGLVKDTDPTYQNTQANAGHHHGHNHTATTALNTGIGGNVINGVDYGNTNTTNATHAHAPHGAHGGYYTQPQGTGVNPYGYENTQTGVARDF